MWFAWTEKSPRSRCPGDGAGRATQELKREFGLGRQLIDELDYLSSSGTTVRDHRIVLMLEASH
ncbi:hypothetical protein ACQPTN_23950 [Bradyrhizobium sp. 13971]